uniref:Calcineurin-like phosphoesterase domain-containing protein n=1 Tax=Desulfobacca acetoxidans TaxID=60893 RepID=A0A7V4G6M8_9BACT
MGRLALVADTHTYQAGLPVLFDFFRNQGITRLACLGDCPPEPFHSWLRDDPGRELYWVYDFYGPPLPAATRCDMALEVEGRVFLAHTRAILWTRFHSRLRAYEGEPPSGRPPLLLCHGHTHVPSVTQFRPPASRLLYINDAPRLRDFQSRQACLTLAADAIYLIVPGAFTVEEGRYPTFSFAVLDLECHRVFMVSMRDLSELDHLTLW